MRATKRERPRMTAEGVGDGQAGSEAQYTAVTDIPTRPGQHRALRQSSFHATTGLPHVLDGYSRRLPCDWRDHLPAPAAYYKSRVQGLGRPNAAGWAQGLCPFHWDRQASLSVHLTSPRGGWRCFAGCGEGDLVAFQMALTGRPFKEAVRDLLRGVR